MKITSKAFFSLSAPYKRLFSVKFMTCYERDSVKDQKKKIIAVTAQHGFMAGQHIFHTAVNSSPSTIASPQTLSLQPNSVDHIDCSHPFKNLNFILLWRCIWNLLDYPINRYTVSCPCTRPLFLKKLFMNPKLIAAESFKPIWKPAEITTLTLNIPDTSETTLMGVASSHSSPKCWDTLSPFLYLESNTVARVVGQHSTAVNNRRAMADVMNSITDSKELGNEIYCKGRQWRSAVQITWFPLRELQ